LMFAPVTAILGALEPRTTNNGHGFAAHGHTH
jgi:hypothetical protein